MLSAKAHRAPRAPVVAARALILGAALALVVVGCGDGDDDGDDASAESHTELTFTLDSDGPGGEPAQTETATCATGARDACGRVKATDFAPLDPATPCTQIYGGPDEVAVEGTVSGDEISATLTRVNGCEIERFDRLMPLLRELFPGYEPGASLKP